MPSSRHRFRYAVAGFLALALATNLPATSANAQENVTVRLNWLAAGYTAPFYLGVEKGWYREAGLNVTVNEGQGSGPTAQQVAAGQTTFGFVSSDAAIRIVAQGAPIKIVAGLADTNGYCVLVKADSGIRTGKDLQGKRYGANPASSIGRLLPAYLKASGVPIDSVQRISVDYANLYAGFLGGQFEGMESLAFDEPPRFEARGVPVRCLEYADAGVKILGPGLVASLSTIESKPNLVRSFIGVTLRAFEHSFKNPEEAAAVVKKMAGDSVANPAVSVQQLKLYQKVQGPKLGHIDLDAMRRSVSLVSEYLELKNAPTDMGRLVTNEFLPK